MEPIELNKTAEQRTETARKLGITETMLDNLIYKIKCKYPHYNKGYDYNSLLQLLPKMR